MHHCGRCGTDLTRLRAVRDPVYGLPLVRCPSCGMTLVRRKHPLPVWTRRICRAIPVFFVLLAQAFILPIVAMGFVGMSAAMAEEIMIVGFRRDGTMQPDFLGAFLERYADRPEEMGALIAMCCIAGLVGVWMGLFMRHWKRGVILAVWLLLVLGYIGLDALRAGQPSVKWFFDPMLGEPWIKTPAHAKVWVTVVLASLPLVLALSSIGGAVARAMDRRRFARRKKKLAKLRQARTTRHGRTS